MKGWSVHTISITVRAPVLCQGLAALAAGVDASALRDSAGRPILPGDQIKGLIRAFARDMQPDAVMELFGPEHGDEDTAKTGFEPARGAIIVSDCALVETAPPQADPMAKFTGPPSWTPWVPAALPERMRVEIDDDLGRAKDGHLLFAESVAPSGTLLRFEGRIHVREAQAGRLDLIRHALSAIPAFGAYRSIGWGEHVSALSAITPAASRNPVTLTDRSADRIAITVSFDRPLLVDAARTAHNVFTGAQVLPGAVIKGALASALAGSKGWLDGPAGDALSDCRITHAWPLDAHGEPICRALPRSLVSGRDGDGQLVIADMALAGTNESAALIGGLAAFYTPDWKGDQFSAAKAALGWSQADDPVREQRTRVKIGADGVAEDRNLFVYEAVRETMDDGAARQWRLEMDRGDADRDAFLALLDALAGGLAGIGKTDAVMTVHDMAPVPAPGVVDPYEAGNRDHWVVTLASPAMMLDPDEKPDAQVQYTDYWREALAALGLETAAAAEIDLASHFAADRLAGGYLALRYRLYGRDVYRPFWLTEPGSVFVLSSPPEQRETMRGALVSALKSGLPARRPVAMPGGGPLTWRNCPFVPANGYGAIEMLGEAHATLRIDRIEGGEIV